MSIMGCPTAPFSSFPTPFRLNRFISIDGSTKLGGSRQGTRIEYSMEEKGYESDKDQLKMLVAETKWTVGVWELMD